MSYSAKYIDHFSNPRSVGEIDNPDAFSEVQHEGGGCFDTVKLTLKLRSGRISEAMFRARACSGTIAACSALVEKIRGMDINDARDLTPADIADYLGGIPEKKQHSVELVIKALDEALSR